MEGLHPVRVNGGYYEIVQPQPRQDPEAEAACDVSKTFGVPCPAPEGPSSIDAERQSLEIVVHHRAFSYLIAAIRKMQG